MKHLRDPDWGLIILFLALLAFVPALQTLKEARAGDGIRAFELFRAFPTATHLRSFERHLEDDNWAAQLSRPALQYAQFAWLGHGGEKAVLGQAGWYFYQPGVKYLLASPDNSSAAPDPAAAIVDFRDQLAARGIHLLVMPVPNKESIYPDRLNSRASGIWQAGPIAPRTSQVLARLRAANVEVLDLFREFREARQQNHPLYLAQDTHWSPAGLALAARAAARRLTGLGWIQPGPIAYQEQPAPVRRLGDILRMLQSPLVERHIQPEIVSAMQVIRPSDAQPYRDEATAEILILGDSFMRICQHDAPTSAGFIAHLAKELKQPMMSLVNDGGGSTLVREEIQAQPAFLKNKKVVLWEFVERDISLGKKGWPRTPLQK